MTVGVEVWRGGVNPWECDEMGHLNVRFYARNVSEAVAAFAPHLGLPDAFREDARSTLVIRGHHIRFLKEARDRATLRMTATLMEVTETKAKIAFILLHTSEEEEKPCATFLTTVAHVDRESRALPWPAATHSLSTGDVPDYARPRSLSDAPIVSSASLTRADELGLLTLSAGAITARDVDIFGRMEAEVVIGRVSDSVLRLVAPFRAAVVDHADPKPTRIGGAVLEYRVVYLESPRAGDRFVIRSGVAGADGRGQYMINWILDPASGKPWAVSQMYVITLDMDARKIVPVSDAARDVVLTRVPEGLTL